jgi:hypothetical protein
MRNPKILVPNFEKQKKNLFTAIFDRPKWLFEKNDMKTAFEQKRSQSNSP